MVQPAAVAAGDIIAQLQFQPVPQPLAPALLAQTGSSESVALQLQGALPQPLLDLSEGLETPIQLIYLTALLGFLAAGAYLVVRQVLIRRELDEAAKGLGERIRTGEATCEVRPLPQLLCVIGAAVHCGTARAMLAARLEYACCSVDQQPQ